jgi:hypothetical protein
MSSHDRLSAKMLTFVNRARDLDFAASVISCEQ